MKKWNLVVDVAECHNCNNCFIACKDEHVGNDIPGYAAPQPLHGHRWINILTRERGRAPLVDAAHLPTMCNHCDDAPCVAAGRGAVRKRADGIVLIDPKAAVGRRDLVAACPYGAIWWNEELNLPQAWTFDAHLLDRGWSAPRCVQSCPTGALRAVKATDAEMAALAGAERLEPLQPELGTHPRVYYRNLYRYTKLFVGGSVSRGAQRRRRLPRRGQRRVAASWPRALQRHDRRLRRVQARRPRAAQRRVAAARGLPRLSPPLAGRHARRRVRGARRDTAAAGMSARRAAPEPAASHNCKSSLAAQNSSPGPRVETTVTRVRHAGNTMSPRVHPYFD